jgi:hypothetical protein
MMQNFGALVNRDQTLVVEIVETPNLASLEVKLVLAGVFGLSPPFDGDSFEIELMNVQTES